jgi:hypothetical protein
LVGSELAAEFLAPTAGRIMADKTEIGPLNPDGFQGRAIRLKAEHHVASLTQQIAELIRLRSVKP